MKFIVQWKGLPTAQQSAIERFMKTGGALPPDGITMLGRWHAIGELSGCAIVEADSTAPLAAWVLQFGDIFTFTISPAVTDEELGKALAAFQAGR
ncbi:uncharacterized protein DUF3303 [Paraburkholderia sp. GV068]|jgi:hypothetical protein|uniref:DUF3303 domain-containing protein n=1 Tax=Paraburkholderia TaxID=1822464 RepID=UPI0006B3F3AD|nr:MULTISPECIES: DUF3303 domain-containing protein [Paraburkholderia]ALE54006.1 hypothetical protein AC233_04110 [Burkholderia sp. HB1]MDQ0622193.1 hypothetical protein [Paraburkholderia graminis]MDR6477140.1 hypothetical protein [Paraburkholderia graminis]PTR02320.1 uncharacterized protein DUF3303 [Paraburkholderia sp. GV072]PUB06797.1 uncharacterized protein DUF3303 [Paraburkholderia sp. GV068]